MNLLVINYMALPLPAVKGGAVEYLVNAFIDDNEKNHFHDIVLYSIYDADAEKESKKYKYTEFRFIKIAGIYDKISRIVRHAINKIPNIYVGNCYISKLLKAEKDWDKYDAIIIENAPEFGLMIPDRYRSKLILHLHNDYLNCKTKKAKEIFDCYKNIFTISNSLGKNVQTIEKSDKVKTLYNGIDLSRFSFDEDKRRLFRAKYNIENDDFVFMYCGRIVPDKGAYEMAEAFSAIERKNVKLLIVGGSGYSKNDESEYIRKIKKLDDDRIIFTGFVPYSEISGLYSVSDAGVIPSIVNDAFNLTVIEFFACGVPVIISDRGAMKELVSKKCSVIAAYDKNFVSNLCDSMNYILKNLIKTDEIKEAAKSVAYNFGIDRYCVNFNDLLTDFRKGNENG